MRPRIIASYLAIAATLAAMVFSLAALGGWAVSCRTEDSTRTRIGVDRFGCVWFGPVQGNGHGRIVVNRPGQDR